MLTPQTCRVALLAGGNSGEREISLASGEGARRALEEAGFLVTSLDPANKEDLKTLIEGEFDVAFLCMHGKNGEDGTLQGFLEIAGIPYTGSGVWSSSLAMDKAKSKVFYRAAGVPTPLSFEFASPEEALSADVFSSFEGKCVVKPVAEGSALGVSIVETAESFEETLRQLFASSNRVMVEQYISGVELTVGVLGTKEPYALPVIEIVPKSEFYDFESKYAPGGSQHICPARLSEEVTLLVQEYAVRAHKALGCSGMSRSDFILDACGGLWILETNTIPGMTGTSLLPDAARAAGIGFSDLCTLLIEFALED